ncbi:MAG: choice-of-anchor tandem repeat GloVer-containing protein [Candidatus Korobacteraceae bacterium]
MHTNGRSLNGMFHSRLQLESVVLALTIILLFLTFVFLFLFITAQPAQGQTYSVIYNFTGGNDGAYPQAGLTVDRAGNLYGTAWSGGFPGEGCTSNGFIGCGTVFKLVPSPSAWVFSTLYSFRGGTDGAWPYSGLTIGADGTLYGTTTRGGKAGSGALVSCGTVFSLKPPSHPHRPWRETVIYRFQGGNDGAGAASGDVSFDPAGHMYGTTDGGGYCAGKTTVFELQPINGDWTESVLYRFSAGSDGAGTDAGVILDSAGNLYDTSIFGGNTNGVCGSDGCGTVFELSRSAKGWTKTILYSFLGGSDGEYPYGGLIFDSAGNLYGTTLMGGGLGGGVAYKLSPSGGGNWSETVIHRFNGTGLGSLSALVMDISRNLYGTNYSDGAYGAGTVFKLAPSGNTWTYTSLHDFTGGNDGGGPVGGVALNAHGNLFGNTQNGGTGSYCYYRNCGVVWEITP